MMQWYDIKETKPPRSGDYIVYNGLYVGAAYYTLWEWISGSVMDCSVDDGIINGIVTHWAELPAPPDE